MFGKKEEVLVISQNMEKRWCGFCKRNNHMESSCWKKQNMADQQRGSRYHKECYNCGKVGHFSID